MTTLTLEEQERRAYADGDAKRATLLAIAIDGDEVVRERIDYLEDKNHRLQQEVDDLQDELEAR